MDLKDRRIAELETELNSLKSYLQRWAIPFPRDGVDRRPGIPKPRTLPTTGYGELMMITVPRDPNRRHGKTTSDAQ